LADAGRALYTIAVNAAGAAGSSDWSNPASLFAG